MLSTTFTSKSWQRWVTRRSLFICSRQFYQSNLGARWSLSLKSPTHSKLQSVKLYHSSSFNLKKSSKAIESIEDLPIETITDSEGNEYRGQIKNGKKHGTGLMKYADGNSYDGTWKNDKPDGSGSFVLKDIGIYTGEVKNGKFRGKGIMKFDGGDFYEGEFKSDNMHGKGIYKSVDGTMYEGDFTKGEQQGEGVMKCSNGDIYSGAFHKGEYHGKGLMKFASGDVYDGDWVSGTITGIGKYISATKDVYEGELKNGHYHGKGSLLQATGNTYTGSFVDGMYSGIGIATLDEGVIYEGEWKQGEMNGHGKLSSPNGDMYQGNFVNCLFEGEGQLTTSLYSYKGSFTAGMREGHGTLLYKTGESYKGEWSKNKRDGQGEYIGLDGYRYSGRWIEDNIAGQGELELPNGEHFLGSFVSGEYHGYGILQKKGLVDKVQAARMTELLKSRPVSKDWQMEEFKYKDKMAEEFLSVMFEDQPTNPTDNTTTATVDSSSSPEGVSQNASIEASTDNNDSTIDEGDEITPDMLTAFKVISTSPLVTYEGDFKQGKMHGVGTMTLINGTVLSGDWKEDKLHGNAVIKDNLGGTILKGVFHNGQLIGDTEGEEPLSTVEELKKALMNSGLTQVSQQQIKNMYGGEKSMKNYSKKGRLPLQSSPELDALAMKLAKEEEEEYDKDD